MLKKVAYIILSFVLLATTGGFTVSAHYCGNTRASIAIDHQAKSCCDSSCGKCRTEEHYVKMKEDFNAPLQHEVIQIAQINLLLLPVLTIEQAVPENAFSHTLTSLWPPGLSGPEILVLNQTFLL